MTTLLLSTHYFFSMPPKKTQKSTAPLTATIIVLGFLVFILLFVLISGNQSAKTTQTSLVDLQKTNAQLQKAQAEQSAVSLGDRLKAVGVDAGNLWSLGDCKVPYCAFTKVSVQKEEGVASVRSIERWTGFYEAQKGDAGSCDAFVFADGTKRGVDMKLLATIEQKLLKDSTKEKPIQLSVFRNEDAPIQHPCDEPATVLNVHFE